MSISTLDKLDKIAEGFEKANAENARLQGVVDALNAEKAQLNQTITTKDKAVADLSSQLRETRDEVQGIVAKIDTIVEKFGIN